MGANADKEASKWAKDLQRQWQMGGTSLTPSTSPKTNQDGLVYGRKMVYGKGRPRPKSRTGDP